MILYGAAIISMCTSNLHDMTLNALAFAWVL
jgi:hypothetical protein